MSSDRRSLDAELRLVRPEGLTSLARSLVGDAHLADDVVQDAMLAVVRRPPAEDVPLGPWLVGIVRNMARMKRRGEARRASREGQAAAPREAEPAAAAVARAETNRMLIAAVLALPEPYRAAVAMNYLDGLPAAEIARQTGVPAATVRTHVHRGLALLRERLDADHGDRRAWCALLAPVVGRGRAARTGAAIGTVALFAGGLTMATKVTVAAVAVAAAAGGWALRSAWTTDDERPREDVSPPAAPPVRPEPPPVAAPPRPPRVRAEADAATKSTSPASPAAAPTPKAEAVIRGHVRTRDGRPVAGALVLVVPVKPADPRPLGAAPRVESDEQEVARFLDSVRKSPVAGSVDARTGADGAYALTVAPDGVYWIWAWADGYDMHAAAGVSVKDVRAGGGVEFQTASVEDLQRTAMDVAASETDRIHALQTLRFVRGAITPSVAESLVALLRTSKDAEVRADVIRNLHRCGYAGLRDALIAALRDDSDERVREQAARDIDDFISDDSVRQALTTAKDSDASGKVRSAAAKTLSGGGR